MTREELFWNYQQNIGIPSPLEVQYLNDWLEKLPLDVVNEAVSEAVLNNKKNMRYINKVLKSWLADGVKTLEDVEERLEKHEAGKQAKQGQSNRPPQGSTGYVPKKGGF